MHRFRCGLLRTGALLALGSLSACGGGTSSPAGTGYVPFTTFSEAISTAKLYSQNTNNGNLEFWPIQKGGAPHPTVLAKGFRAGPQGLAADGNTLVITRGAPPEIVLYNVTTKMKSTLADPFGAPFDVAVGKTGSIFAVNAPVKKVVTFTVYPAPSMKPFKVTCGLITFYGSLAVDNENDIFDQSALSSVPSAVVEIPAGADGKYDHGCAGVPLLPDMNPAGITFDPKTDDLITLSDPDECAGGIEGQMTVYPKPYKKANAEVVQLGGNCTGGIRLNADSTLVFYGDEDVSGSFTFIRSSTYPAGTAQGIYWGGSPGGTATIPNSLPN